MKITMSIIILSSWIIIVRVWNYEKEFLNHGTEILLLMIKYYIILSFFSFARSNFAISWYWEEIRNWVVAKHNNRNFEENPYVKLFHFRRDWTPLLLHSITVLKYNDMHTKQGLDANFRTKKVFLKEANFSRLS